VEKPVLRAPCIDAPTLWRLAGIAATACASVMPTHAAEAPAAAATCVACHGSHGEGSASGAPRLAGQNATYLERALSAFKAGTRVSVVMQPIASGLADPDVHALAAYFAGLHGTALPAAASPTSDLVRAGAELANVGAPSDPTPACFSCHGAAGRTDSPRFPNLAGQPAEYVVDRLHAYQARARAATPEPATMRAVAAHLSEAQVRQVAAYLSTLPPP
jgi:cytochrome c553